MPDGDERRWRHDLGNAFNHLTLCVELVGIERDPAEILCYLDGVNRSADRCDRLLAILEVEPADGEVVEEQPETPSLGGVPASHSR